MDFDPLSNSVIGCAIEVHRHLGPGLLESTYQKCLLQELQSNQIKCKTEVSLPVHYKNTKIDCGYRIDILVEDKIIIELKSVESLAKIHEAQIITYMRLSKIPIGLLMNFNQIKLVDGLRRFVL